MGISIIIEVGEAYLLIASSEWFEVRWAHGCEWLESLEVEPARDIVEGHFPDHPVCTWVLYPTQGRWKEARGYDALANTLTVGVELG